MQFFCSSKQTFVYTKETLGFYEKECMKYQEMYDDATRQLQEANCQAYSLKSALNLLKLKYTCEARTSLLCVFGNLVTDRVVMVVVAFFW